MIRFQLLGEIGLLGADGAPLDQLLRQPKRLALLAYLACPTPGTWHRRDTLLGLFWPEMDTQHARTSLRNALYVLRQGLGAEAVRTRGDEEVSLDPGLVETDLAELGELIRAGRSGEALSGYRGELLAGLYAPDSEGFQRWLDGERARLRLAVAQAGLNHAAMLEREGRLGEAREAARRVLEVHPDDETAVRRLMGLHQAMGDRAGALAAFEEYRLRLAREYEAEPSPETQALAEELRGPAEAPAPKSRAAPPAEPPIRSVSAEQFVERRRPATDAPRLERGAWRRTATITAASILVFAGIGWGVLRRPSPPQVGESGPVASADRLQIEPAISPNGRLVAYAMGDSRRMRIYIQRLAGGDPWLLSGDTNSVEILPRWSPDNDQVAFLARRNAYVAAAVGGRPRLVASGGEGETMVRSASWSPNGDSILIVRNDSLLVRPLEGPGARFAGRGSQIHSCVWSPGGEWIACVSGNRIAFEPGPLFGNQAPSGLLLFPATGGDPIELTDREHAHVSPAWSTDGRWLWFLSNLDGAWGEAYAVRIRKDGRPDGPPERMGLQAESISLAANRLVYSVYSRKANVWSVPIRPHEVLGLDSAVQVTTGTQLVELVMASRDGRWLVYDSDVRGNADIFRMPIGGGRPERLTDDPRPEYAADLSPDNRMLAYQLWTEGRRRLFLKDLETGAATEALPDTGDQSVVRWSPAGAAIAVWYHGVEPGAIYVSHRDSAGRWGKAQWRLGNAQLPIWSPDGRGLAFLRITGAIEVIPADSGPTRVLYAPRPGSDDPQATFLAWDPGQSELWFLGNQPSGRAGIWGLPLGGGRPHLMVDFRDPAGRVNGPSVTSDGARFYFTLDERLSNVRWAKLRSH